MACAGCLSSTIRWLNDRHEHPRAADSVPSWLTREYSNRCPDTTSRAIVTAFGPDRSLWSGPNAVTIAREVVSGHRLEYSRVSHEGTESAARGCSCRSLSQRIVLLKQPAQAIRS